MFVHFVLLIYIPIYFDHIGSSHTRSCHSFFPWPHGRVQGSSGVALTKRLGEGLLFGGVADHKTTVHNEIFTYCKLKHIYISCIYVHIYLYRHIYIYIYTLIFTQCHCIIMNIFHSYAGSPVKPVFPLECLVRREDARVPGMDRVSHRLGPRARDRPDCLTVWFLLPPCLHISSLRNK